MLMAQSVLKYKVCYVGKLLIINALYSMLQIWGPLHARVLDNGAGAYILECCLFKHQDYYKRNWFIYLLISKSLVHLIVTYINKR